MLFSPKWIKNSNSLPKMLSMKSFMMNKFLFLLGNDHLRLLCRSCIWSPKSIQTITGSTASHKHPINHQILRILSTILLRTTDHQILIWFWCGYRPIATKHPKEMFALTLSLLPATALPFSQSPFIFHAQRYINPCRISLPLYCASKYPLTDIDFSRGSVKLRLQSIPTPSAKNSIYEFQDA